MALAPEQEINNSGQIASYWRVRNVAMEFPTMGRTSSASPVASPWIPAIHTRLMTWLL
jgi:hypothetical protein